MRKRTLEAKYERRYTCAEDIKTRDSRTTTGWSLNQNWAKQIRTVHGSQIKTVYSLRNNDVFTRKIMKIYHDHLFLKKYSQEEISDKLEKGTVLTHTLALFP